MYFMYFALMVKSTHKGGGEMLVAKHLKKYYGKYRGVEDVSFSIKPGKYMGSLGPMVPGKQLRFALFWGSFIKTLEI